MPLYDFACRACGKEFEVLVMGADVPACPYCQSTDLAKLMSTFATRIGGGSGSSESSGSGGSSKCAGCAGKSCSSCH